MTLPQTKSFSKIKIIPTLLSDPPSYNSRWYLGMGEQQSVGGGGREAQLSQSGGHHHAEGGFRTHINIKSNMALALTSVSRAILYR